MAGGPGIIFGQPLIVPRLGRKLGEEGRRVRGEERRGERGEDREGGEQGEKGRQGVEMRVRGG